MKKIALATTNVGKIAEFRAILSEFEFITQDAFGVSEVAEDGLSFIENALIKARHAAKHTELPTIADDSGLVIPALGGEPGIHSARYSGGGSAENIAKVLEKMQGITQREAYFYCAIALVAHHKDPTPIIALGKWQGEILSEQRGENGFGYDPIFYLTQYGKTAAELPPEEKNNISHRALALHSLALQLQ